MDKQLKKVLKQNIVIEQVATIGSRGGKTYSAAFSVPCYIAGQIKMVRDNAGQEITSTLSVFITGTVAQALNLSHNDRITLPDGRQPPILAIIPYIGEKGDLYSIEVNL